MAKQWYVCQVRGQRMTSCSQFSLANLEDLSIELKFLNLCACAFIYHTMCLNQYLVLPLQLKDEISQILLSKESTDAQSGTQLNVYWWPWSQLKPQSSESHVYTNYTKAVKSSSKNVNFFYLSTKSTEIKKKNCGKKINLMR